MDKKKLVSKLILAIVGLVAVFSLQWLPANKTYLSEQAGLVVFRNALKAWKKKKQPSASEKMWIEAFGKGKSTSYISMKCSPGPCNTRVLWFLKKKNIFLNKGKKKGQELGSIKIQSAGENTFQRSNIKFYSKDGSKPIFQFQGKQKIIRWTSILPPLLAIFFVLLTKKVLLSLFLSLFFGVLLLVDWNIGQAFYHTTATYVWKKAMFKEFSFNVIVFTLSLIGMINVCSKNGGVKGLIDKIAVFAKNAKSARLTTALMGLVIFFDDYANSIMVGNTMRPLTDKFRVSREKLAYLVDSTAAPIAGVALLSTWVGYEVGLLGDLSKHLELGMTGYSLFFESLGYRFYCWFSLIFLFMGVFLQRDFGPMLKAERRAWETGQLFAENAEPMTKIELHNVEPSQETPARWYNAFVPIMTVLFSGFVGLLWSGGFFSGKSLSDALSSADNTKVFLYASLFGSLVAIVLSISQRLISFTEAIIAWLSGAKAMLFAVGILIFAWSMGALAKDIGTAHYLIAMLKGNISALWIPLLIFFMAACVSFATGTSWGTMGILLPTVVPLAHKIGGETSLILSVGAVLDGSIFGDHCSPLSDTTLFSSAATSCDHVDHVRTQVPYAMTVMIFASLCGYLAISMRVPLWTSFVIAPIGFFAVYMLIGKETNPISNDKKEATS